MVNQGEVGVGDFVLMDKIDIDNFMENLELRWVKAWQQVKQALLFSYVTRPAVIVFQFVSVNYVVRILGCN